MSPDSMASGWYFTKPGDSSAQQGPLSWQDLYTHAQAGAFGPDDLVWNPQLPEWLPAAQIPGLFPAAVPPPTSVQTPSATPYGVAARPTAQPAWTAQPTAPQPAPQPAYQPSAPASQPSAPAYQPSAPADQPPRRRTILPWLIPLIAIIIVGAGLGTYFGVFYHRGQSGGEDGSNVSAGATSTTEPAAGLGATSSKAPDRAKLVETAKYGEVPANQIVVTLADGSTRKNADALATALGGTVTGEIQFINTYQIETTGATEADLQATIDKAAAMPGVMAAFANEETSDDVEIWGVRQTPLTDPVYANGHDKGFELMGAQKAWNYIKGSGLPIYNVQVGVVDTGLYTGHGEYEGDTNVSYIGKGDQLTAPNKDTNPKNHVTVDDPNGSHGTMVSNVIGADPTNGGVTGLASPALGHHLTISEVNKNSGAYGNPEVQNPDPNDPTVVKWSDSKSYSFGCLVAISKQIEAGSKVVNCSWSSRPNSESEEWSKAYQQFFEKMAKEHPDVLFVCSAGNTNQVKDGAVTWPGGRNLPNMVTVGNVQNDGTVGQSGSSLQNTDPGHEYEVTLAAPGHEVIQGVDSNGNPIDENTDIGNGRKYGGGTSAAAPEVSSAAAMLLALNPNLTAGEIKDILTKTARPGPESVGGKILAIDQAVLAVINQQREKQGLPAVTGEDLEKAGAVDAVATSTDDPDVYSVRGILAMVPDGGTDVVFTGSPGITIEGAEATQSISAPGEVNWPTVNISTWDPEHPPTITVTRKDNGSASVITLQAVDLNGHWEGTFTITDFSVDQSAATTAGGDQGSSQGCDLAVVAALLEKLKGMPIPMTMDITADMKAGSGSTVMVLDMESVVAKLNEGVPDDQKMTATNQPQTIPFTISGVTITFKPEASSGSVSSMTGTVAQQGSIVTITGVLTSSGTGFSMTAAWTVTKR